MGEITMKIAFITDSYIPTVDGVVTAVVTIKKELEDMGHSVTVIAPDPGKDKREEGTIYFPAISFKKYKGYFLPIFRSNKIELIKDLDPDIIHIYGEALMSIKGLIASRTLKIPSVATYVTSVGEVINDYSPIRLPAPIMDRLVWTYLRSFLKRPSALIVPTRPIAEELIGHGVKAKRLETIHIGVDVKRFTRNEEDGNRIREKHNVASKRVVICAGRLSSEKNIDLLIRSMRSVDGNTVLIIVGKGPMDAELRQLSKDLGLDEKVIFTGFVPDEELVAYYSAADIAASCSKFETQGLTTLEAMSCGLPTACADARAFIEFVKDGVNGQRFTSDEKSCSGAIMKCLNDKEKLSAGARATAEAYSIRETAVKLERLYEEIIQERSS
ncbi:MAG: glycosyltransferase [Methanomassiliicoccaceae archaeon]|jgi:1,2-diacylglycerol 3-alpha-glucosyltransferase|nr:glycosyltransferase [Methanomassiliicoccaceae archaeon]